MLYLFSYFQDPLSLSLSLSIYIYIYLYIYISKICIFDGHYIKSVKVIFSLEFVTLFEGTEREWKS